MTAERFLRNDVLLMVGSSQTLIVVILFCNKYLLAVVFRVVCLGGFQNEAWSGRLCSESGGGVGVADAVGCVHDFGDGGVRVDFRDDVFDVCCVRAGGGIGVAVVGVAWGE